MGRSKIASLATCGLLLSATGVATSSAIAEEETLPEVGLERLLTLPDSFDPEGPRVGGASETQWRARFSEAHAAIETARQSIDQAQQQLESVVGEGAGWQASAPGLGTDPTASPVSYKLRDDLRRNREELADAEKRLLDLKVEANLAAVPEEWRR